MIGPVRVMVVDDQALVREGLTTLFETTPDIKPVAMASDGEEAVALCARHRPDVVLMDLRMPKLDGVEATRRIRAAQPDTRSSSSPPTPTRPRSSTRCRREPGAI